jgi:pyrroline-5-carboxylate reductase
MGEALLSGMLRAGKFRREEIIVSDILPERVEQLSNKYGVKCTLDNLEVAEKSDVIVLCVQPIDVVKAIQSIKASLNKKKLLISIAAGVGTDYIQRFISKDVDLVRAMPNNPCMVGEGMIVLTAAEGTPSTRLEEAKEIFTCVGRTMFLGEHLFDAVTGLSGSGPAYFYLFIEALADGGVKVGIPKEAALILAAQTALGAAKMVLETGVHPAKLKDLVATPGGTTIYGLAELEEGNIRAALLKAVERATKRARELVAH